MINPVTQSFVANVAPKKIDQEGKATKANEAGKMEDKKVSQIAEQIQNGEYKLDTKATAEAIVDSLI